MEFNWATLKNDLVHLSSRALHLSAACTHDLHTQPAAIYWCPTFRIPPKNTPKHWLSCLFLIELISYSFYYSAVPKSAAYCTASVHKSSTTYDRATSFDPWIHRETFGSKCLCRNYPTVNYYYWLGCIRFAVYRHSKHSFYSWNLKLICHL